MTDPKAVSEQSNTRWVVSAFDFGNTDLHNCAFVTASTEREAAELGAEQLQQSWQDTDGLGDQVIEHVFVGPWPRTVYAVTRRWDADEAEYQCCGGSSGHHFGGCSTVREECCS